MSQKEHIETLTYYYIPQGKPLTNTVFVCLEMSGYENTQFCGVA